MDITKTLQPGDMGTRRHLQKYGEQLIAVRYRVDKINQKRFTTVELIVDEKPYVTLNALLLVWVKINFDEVQLRQQVKVAGAKWLSDEKVWEMKYAVAEKFHLKKRIVKRITNTDGQV